MSLFSTADVASLRTDRLALMLATYLQGFAPSDGYLLSKLQAAEAETSHALKVLFEPTTIFPTQPTPAQITAIGAKPTPPSAPYLVEPGYDYDPSFFEADKWGYLVTRQHPIISVTSITLVYPQPTNQVFVIPNDWLRIDPKYGTIRMIPASSAFYAPLGAFLMQALGGGRTIPSMIQVQYVAGLDKTGTGTPYSIDSFPDLIDVIKKKAVLSILQDNFIPGSASISADGLSQSISLKMMDYEDIVNLKLFGPKGANGGLWTAIHGLSHSVLGIIA